MSVLVEGRPDIELDLTGLYQNLAYDKAYIMSFTFLSLFTVL